MVSVIGDWGMGVERYRIVYGIGVGKDVLGLGFEWMVFVKCKLEFVEFLFVSCKWSWLKWCDAVTVQWQKISSGNSFVNDAIRRDIGCG